MNVTYDTFSHVYSVDLKEGEVARTVEFDENHLVDLDEAGHVLSIEVLDPDNARINEIATAFQLEQILPQLLGAIYAIVPSTPVGTSETTTYHAFSSAGQLAQFRSDVETAEPVPTIHSEELVLR